METPAGDSTGPAISVIIPFRNAARYLEPCLSALRGSGYRDFELLAVDDGSTDESAAIARRYSDQVLTLSSSRGPAYARNRGAEAAAGSILFFTDADVICPPDTLAKVYGILTGDPLIDAVIGSYDDAPLAAGFLSRYKNLTHHFVHQSASAEASTFWTGCGAIRRAAFLEFNGFDESYRRPSIEDIDLGYRLREAGRRIALRKDLCVKHAKVWRLAGLLRSDLLDRAVPWTILQLSYGRILNDLNVTTAQRLASIVALLALLSALFSPWQPRLLVATAGSLAMLGVLNRRLYRFYIRKGGVGFALGAIGMHLFYYLYSLVGFAIGYLRFRVRGPDRNRRGTRAASP